MIIPVEVQKPNRPDTARVVGEAPDNWTVEEVARHVGCPLDCVIDGKIISNKMSKKGHELNRDPKGRRWSIVAYIEFGEGPGKQTCPKCGHRF